MGTLTLKSRRTGEDYPVELYEKEGCLIIRHSSLDQIFYGMPDESRPEIHIEPFNMTMLPCTPPIFAIKCTLSTENVHIEQIGELICEDWQASNSVMRSNPLATCQNRAFDKAFIRFMQFDISTFEVFALYSSAEIPVSDDMIPLLDKKVIGKQQDDPGASVAPTPAVSPSAVPEYTPQSDQHVFAQPTPCPIPEHIDQPVPAPASTQHAVPQSVQRPRQEPVHQVYSSYDIGSTESHDAPPMNIDMFATPDGFITDSGRDGMPPEDVPSLEAVFSNWNSMSQIPPHGNTSDGRSVAPPTPQVNSATIQDGTQPAAPLPWMKGIQEKEQTPPAQAKVPDVPKSAPAPSQVQTPAPKPVTVRRVTFEPTFRMTKVETDRGIVFFHPDSGKWDSKSVELGTMDLNELYGKASACIGCDLSKFYGFLAP